MFLTMKALMRVIQTIAVKNSIEYGKECIDSPNYSRDTKDLIKKDLIDLRNFYPKLQRFYNEFFKSRS